MLCGLYNLFKSLKNKCEKLRKIKILKDIESILREENRKVIEAIEKRIKAHELAAEKENKQPSNNQEKSVQKEIAIEKAM